MIKPVWKKIGIKENMRTIFINAPAEAINAIDFPGLHIQQKLTEDFDYIHFFVKSQEVFKSDFPKLKSHLRSGGMLWVSWPKGGQLETDLSLPKIIDLGYRFGLVESTCLSITPIWSALKFTHPKKGKTYNNSYGKLQI